MDGLRRLVQQVALLVLLLGGAGALLAMFLGTADVVGTQFFGRPIPGALELTEATMVLIVFGALAYAQLRRGHIRVELVYTHMPPRGRAAMDAFTHLIGLIFFGLLVVLAVDEAMFSWSIGEATQGLLRFPLYPARWILVAGTTLMIVQLVLDLILDVQRIAGIAPIEEVDAVAGIPDVSDLIGDAAEARR